MENDGHTVYITRDNKEPISYNKISEIIVCKSLGVTSNSPLSFRKEIANKIKADYFISLHCDGLENLTSNFAVMCYIDAAGKKLAEKIAKNYSKVKGTIASRPDLTVLGNGTENKAKFKVLIEFGFMTTPKIARSLIRDKDIIINDIYKSIREHIDEN